MTTTKELTPAEPREMMAWTPPSDGWASDGNEDIEPTFPMVTLLQPMSQVSNARAGWFHHSDTEQQTPDFDGVLLVRRQTRAMFVKGDEKPICRSDDGVVPAPRQRLWAMEPGDRITFESGKDFGVPMAPRDCEACPFSVWNGDEPPLCSNSYVVIAARNGDPDDLVQIRFKGTAIKPFRQWVSKKLAPKRLPMYFFAIHLEAEEHTEPSRKWWQPVFRSAPLEETDARVYSEIINRHRARIERAVQEAGGEVEAWDDDDAPFE